jgi:hypothetical protein
MFYFKKIVCAFVVTLMVGRVEVEVEALTSNEKFNKRMEKFATSSLPMFTNARTPISLSTTFSVDSDGDGDDAGDVEDEKETRGSSSTQDSDEDENIPKDLTDGDTPEELEANEDYDNDDDGDGTRSSSSSSSSNSFMDLEETNDGFSDVSHDSGDHDHDGKSSNTSTIMNTISSTAHLGRVAVPALLTGISLFGVSHMTSSHSSSSSSPSRSSSSSMSSFAPPPPPPPPTVQKKKKAEKILVDDKKNTAKVKKVKVTIPKFDSSSTSSSVGSDIDNDPMAPVLTLVKILFACLVASKI